MVGLLDEAAADAQLVDDLVDQVAVVVFDAQSVGEHFADLRAAGAVFAADGDDDVVRVEVHRAISLICLVSLVSEVIVPVVCGPKWGIGLRQVSFGVMDCMCPPVPSRVDMKPPLGGTRVGCA